MSHPVTPAYDDFAAAYPGPAAPPDAVSELFDALSPQERRWAIDGARGYRALLADGRMRHGPVPARRFLRDPSSWPEFARHAPTRSDVGEAP